MSDSDSDNEYTFDSDSDEDTTLPDEMAMKQFTEQMNRQRFIEKFPNHRIWVDQLYEWNKLPPDNWIITMMLGGSLFLGGLALFAFMWAVNNGQFDDEEKFLNATKFDNEEDLNDAKVNEEKKRKSKRDYRPE